MIRRISGALVLAVVLLAGCQQAPPPEPLSPRKAYEIGYSSMQRTMQNQGLVPSGHATVQEVNIMCAGLGQDGDSKEVVNASFNGCRDAFLGGKSRASEYTGE